MQHRAVLVGFVAFALVGTACGGDDDTGAAAPSTTATTTTVAPTGGAATSSTFPPITSPLLVPSANLVNGGFEDGLDSWYALSPPDPALDTTLARSGAASARLDLEVEEEDEGTILRYLVQDLDRRDAPERIRGAYRVERWAPAGPHHYAQFVVIAVGAQNDPAGFGNYQLRYILSGTDAEPFTINNAKFVFVGRDDPVLGEWVTFERDLRADFEEAWGVAPEGARFLRFLFEVRVDGRQAYTPPGGAVVHWDDLETEG